MTRDAQHMDPAALTLTLLDWHLDRLSPEERTRVEQRLHDDPRLQTLSDRIGAMLRPLDLWTVPSTPRNLADKVLSNLNRQAYSSQTPVATPVESGGYVRLPFLPLREWVAVAACLVVMVGALMPSLRARSQRVACQNNLASVFRGLSAYQADFSGALPFADQRVEAAWLPDGAQDRPYASNSRHVFLLLKGGYGPRPSDFICDDSEQASVTRGQPLRKYDDFSTSADFRYASLNMAGAAPNRAPVRPIAYLSDMNPLFVNARFNDAIDPDRTNSPAHGGRGQTVLTLDGSARWITAPRVGPQRDNLWLAGDIRRYTGTERRAGDDDAQLVPGFPITDPMVSRRLNHPHR